MFNSSLLKVIHNYSSKNQTNNLIANDNEKKRKTHFRFPWWMKIFAYILSYALIGLSSFFLFVKGVELGNDNVYSWLRSVIISVIASIFLTSPVKVKNCPYYDRISINCYKFSTKTI